MNAPKKILAGIAATALIGISGLAFAHGGWGGRNMNGGYGHMMGGGGHMGNPGYHMGYGDEGGFANLTQDQQDKLADSRDDFFRATETLRENVYLKRNELARALDRDNPEAAKVQTLQKELSGLEAQFDQKRLAHQLELKKIAPELGRRSGGRGMGNNFNGYCWN